MKKCYRCKREIKGSLVPPTKEECGYKLADDVCNECLLYLFSRLEVIIPKKGWI